MSIEIQKESEKKRSSLIINYYLSLVFSSDFLTWYSFIAYSGNRFISWSPSKIFYFLDSVTSKGDTRKKQKASIFVWCVTTKWERKHVHIGHLEKIYEISDVYKVYDHWYWFHTGGFKYHN